MIKAKSWYLIIVVVIVAGAVSFAIAGVLFKAEKVKTKAEVVETITSDFPAPDPTYFNKNSLNPTQTIIIGDGNPQPFRGP